MNWVVIKFKKIIWADIETICKFDIHNDIFDKIFKFFISIILLIACSKNQFSPSFPKFDFNI